MLSPSVVSTILISSSDKSQGAINRRKYKLYNDTKFESISMYLVLETDFKYTELQQKTLIIAFARSYKPVYDNRK